MARMIGTLKQDEEEMLRDAVAEDVGRWRASLEEAARLAGEVSHLEDEYLQAVGVIDECFYNHRAAVHRLIAANARVKKAAEAQEALEALSQSLGL